MESAPIPDTGVSAVATTTTPPRRRWSDGPAYPWSPGTEDAWSVGAHWPALAALLCEQVAGGTHELMGELERLTRHGLLSQAQAASMRQSMQSMRSAGMALQQIVRLGSGLHNLSPDRVELAALARNAIRERQRELLQAGVDVSMDLHRALVWVDGAVAVGLMHSGIEWALSFSRKVRVKVVAGDSHGPARLIIRGALPSGAHTAHTASPVRGARPNRRMNDNLHWVLMRQLASAARLPVSRSSSAATEAAVIEFPGGA